MTWIVTVFEMFACTVVSAWLIAVLIGAVMVLVEWLHNR